MRKIVCQCCENRYGDSASWLIFKNTFICESCRLAAIEYLRDVCDLSLAKPHVFLDELTTVESNKKFKKPLDMRRRVK